MRDDGAYWARRQRSVAGIQAVGYRTKSAGFNQWMYRVRERTAGAVIARITRELGARIRVLDVGAGTGFYVRLWKNRPELVQLVGIDVSREAVERLRHLYPDCGFFVAEVGSGSQLPVEGSFDVVQCMDVLYHITEDGRFERALKQVAERVRPGGFLLVTDNFPARDVTTRPHVRLRSRATYARVLAGFEPVLEVPQFLLLNVPSGVAAPWLRWPLVLFWEVLTWPARVDPLGTALGAALATVDRALLPLVGSRTPSTKLAVYRRAGERKLDA
ncbi:MAG: class I SAM-dependent methyltransferase [Gemmatimonadetes bacterium]|nr:class I SAM-dependent methyltransferase [Gemmatimonadota bacterium]